MQGESDNIHTGHRLELVTPRYRPDRPGEPSAHSAGLSHGLQLAAGSLGALLAGAALVIGLSVEPLRAVDVVRAVAEALAISVPVAAGLYAMHREQTSRFARLLVIAGLAWAPSVLAMSDSSVPYSVGRAWAWGVLAWMVYLLLAFPLGHLASRGDRWLVGGAVALVGLFYLPTIFFTEFPSPSPWTSCRAHCPANAFIVSDSEPGVIRSILSVRDLLAVLLYTAAATIVGFRWARRSETARRVDAPVVVVAIAYFVIAGLFLAARKAAANADATELAALAALVSTPALVLAFLAGLIRWRVAAFSTWRQLTSEGEAAHVRDLLADAINDPSLEIGYWGGRDRGWIDEDGRPFALPPKGSVRAVNEVSSRGRRVAILVHEDTYMADSALREVVQGVTLMALGNQRLEAEARASLRELSESRSRILRAIDRDRLRVERDLHDGAQQRLIALKIAADRGAANAASDADQAAALFRRIGSDASAALDEVRALAHGVYPALLVDHGLVDALRDAASRSGIPAEVRARGIRRYPQEVEAAVYFCCLEAVQNAEKHSGASSVAIHLTGNGAIRFEVSDDGCGFDTAVHADGAGLGNMNDRVAAVGGMLRVDSVPGAGTRVAGRVPMMMPDHVPEEIERLVLRAADGLEDAMGIYRAVRTSSGTVVDFSVEHVNDAACKSVGLSREAQVGKTLGQLHPGYVRSPTFRWHCEALASDTPVVREECEYARAAGSRRLQIAYEVRAAGLGADRLALVWRDITARKRTEHDLRLRAEALGRERDGVCVVRASSGTIVYANPRFEEMLGYARGDLEGRPTSDLDWIDSPAVGHPGTGRRTLRRATDRFEAGCRRKDGSPIWCEVTIDGFEDEDLGWCWVAVHHDITESREATRRLESQRDELGRALRSLPALAYATDRDLRCTLLFDNLVEPDRAEMPLTGADAELLGASLAKHVTSVNARALVAGRRAEAEVEVDIRGPVTVLVAADPVRAHDGTVIGVVGSVVERSSTRFRAEIARKPARDVSARARGRR
jgi:PAS domain S-box-containing protein